MQSKDFTNRWAAGAARMAAIGTARNLTNGAAKPARSRAIAEGPKASAMTGQFTPVIKPAPRKLKVGPRR